MEFFPGGRTVYLAVSWELERYDGQVWASEPGSQALQERPEGTVGELALVYVIFVANSAVPAFQLGLVKHDIGIMDDLFLGLVELEPPGDADAYGDLDGRDAGCDGKLALFDDLADFSARSKATSTSVSGMSIENSSPPNRRSRHNHGRRPAGSCDASKPHHGQVAVRVLMLRSRSRRPSQRERTVETLRAGQLVLQLVHEIGIMYSPVLASSSVWRSRAGIRRMCTPDRWVSGRAGSHTG